MRQKIVGTFPIGQEYCELVLREDTGGEFYFMPEDGHIARLKIGADYDRWQDVAEVIVHEALELILARARVRFIQNEDMGRDLSTFMFMFSHSAYADACARLTDFLVPALPAAKVAWGKWKKPTKKTKQPTRSRKGGKE